MGYVLRKTRNLFLKAGRRCAAAARRSRLKKKDFTIISNNCWGGDIYQMFGLPYASPTIGLFFYESDYIKFLENMSGYLSCQLEFIPIVESRFYGKVCGELGEQRAVYPVAKLGDVEVHFLHYHSEEEARAKWTRRCQRINFDRLLVKLSERTDCDLSTIQRFDRLDFQNKLCFTKQPHPDLTCCVPVKELASLQNGVTEKEITLKHLDIYQVLNGLK